MARILQVHTSRKSRARPITPPPDIVHKGNKKHPETPSRCLVYAAKLYSQALGIPISKSIVRTVSGVPERVQTRILASNSARTLRNQEGPDPRGRKRGLTRQDTVGIDAYLDDDNVHQDDKGKPWRDIARDAGIILPETTHFKPPGKRTLNNLAIQKACKKDENIINAVMEEEKELSHKEAHSRLVWIDNQLAIRPHSRDWFDVAFCDEFHFGLGPQTTKRIKRKQGRKYRYKPLNVNRKKVTQKDEKGKARGDNNPFESFSVFVVIGPNYRRFIPCNAGNKNGKMSSLCYTSQILPILQEDVEFRGLTLCQDGDSGHKAIATQKWAAQRGFPLLTLPAYSPDFSIMESLAAPVKRKFHAERCSKKMAMERFMLE